MILVDPMRGTTMELFEEGLERWRANRHRANGAAGGASSASPSSGKARGRGKK